MTQHVMVSDLRLPAAIGVHAHEKGRQQMLIVDVEIELAAVDGDHMSDTIDYNSIVAHAVSLAAEHIALIETFATRLADLCLSDPNALRAEVTVRKPGALLNGLAAARSVAVRQF